jgi:hypothetical protein
MPKTFVVIRTKGPAWDHDQPIRAQRGWEGHAQFMDGLFASGFILLGGSLGHGDEIMLLVEAVGEDQVAQTFQGDPWSTTGLLILKSISPWQLLLDFRQKA